MSGKGNINDYICGLVLDDLGRESDEKEMPKAD